MQILDEWARPGLYVLQFPGGAEYVGMSSVSVRARLLHHVCKAGLGGQAAVHRALRKYGRENVAALAIFPLPGIDLCVAEMELIAQKRLGGTRLYNMTSGGEGKLGFSPSQETRRKIGAANRSPVKVQARADSLKRPEVRARMAEGQRKAWTDERKALFADSKRGEAAPCAKLQTEQVVRIKQRLALRESCAAISRDYGVTPEAISRIKCGKAWTHVH